MLRPLTEVVSGSLDRFSSGDGELDRVLGGGLVPGSVVLLGGEPGIGKSTLMLQAALSLAAAGKRVLYVGGEESPEQVRMRAERLGSVVEGIWILPETQTPVVLDVLREQLPDVVVVDSIQTLFHPQVESAPGSVTQIRESASALTAFAKQSQIPMLLVGHITKEGSWPVPRCWSTWWTWCCSSRESDITRIVCYVP
ncbi:MAG: hypothetical protein RJA19_489 [Bacteroidota bacterium]